MGAECSSDCGKAEQAVQNPEDTAINSSTITDYRELSAATALDFKSYKQYNLTSDLMKKRILEIIKKVEAVNDFTVTKR
jgi:hypothetical protein